MSRPTRFFRVSILGIAFLASLAGFGLTSLPIAHSAPNTTFTSPTYSSPIALSSDNAFVWSVNPDDNSVSIIRADTDAVAQKISVGQEPQSIALDPNNRYAYVANAADGAVSVISITTYITTGTIAGFVERTIRTGAEPWNIVISPDGKRVYVANSGQDTISVIRADVSPPALIDHVDLRNTTCNVGDTNRHYQPRGLAVDIANSQLYVTRFLSLAKPGGTQGTDNGKEGVVCRLDINTSVLTPGISGFTPITLTARDSGFGGELAYPNQLQSIVLRGDKAFLPNIAVAPAAPLNFDNDTHAFINRIGGVSTGTQTDLGALNLHLGGRLPESGKPTLFYANPWAIAFSTQSGSGAAYIASAGSDLLVKVLVDPSGTLTFTNGVSTTRYIDLNDPSSPSTSGANAGKNPLGIVIRNLGAGGVKAYVMNYVSRNVSVVDLVADAVAATISLTSLPTTGTSTEQRQVGKEIFFSARGNFDRPGGTTVSTTNRLSNNGWQACSSCHFAGLTDGSIWVFDSGPRKSIPLNGTFNPHAPSDQRVLNYSATQDELEDLELNIRNISGPGPAGGPFDPNHGLLISDTGGINFAPTTLNAFATPNANRPQHSVTLPGSGTSWPALSALREWVRAGIRTPNGALTTAELTAGGGSATGGLDPAAVSQGRVLFMQQGCPLCHSGGKWTRSQKDFASPPSGIDTENPPTLTAAPAQYLPRFLSNINSFNLNVNGGGNLIAGTASIGAIEKASDGKDALGKDYNSDGHGDGYNIPSLLGIWQLPPYYHNGACETLACVLKHTAHRTANGALPDLLNNPADQAKVIAFLTSLDAQTVPMSPLYLPLILR